MTRQRTEAIPRLRQIDAVVFDLDGVLVDSEPMHFRAANRVLGAYGKCIGEADYRGFIGLGEAPTWQVWRERYEIPGSLEEILEAHTQARLQEIDNGIEPIDDAVHLAKALAARGERLAIASSSASPIIDALLSALSLSADFPLRVSGNDPQVRQGKPAPDIYLLTAHRLGVSPDACVAIEDSRNGMLAASRAGMTCVVVPNRWTQDQDFGEADVVLEGLRYFPLLLTG
jgi:HAD superfamily hydrolase (TIGR01509 family)